MTREEKLAYRKELDRLNPKPASAKEMIAKELKPDKLKLPPPQKPMAIMTNTLNENMLENGPKLFADKRYKKLLLTE